MSIPLNQQAVESMLDKGEMTIATAYRLNLTDVGIKEVRDKMTEACKEEKVDQMVDIDANLGEGYECEIFTFEEVKMVLRHYATLRRHIKMDTNF